MYGHQTTANGLNQHAHLKFPMIIRYQGSPQKNRLCDTVVYNWYTSCVLQIQPKDGCFSLEEPLKKDQDLCAHYDVLCLEMWT